MSATPSHGRASLFLVLVCLFWGISFPLVRGWQDAAKDCPGGVLLASATLIAVRFVLACVLLGVAQPNLFRTATRAEYFWGGLLGLAFLLGFVFQVSAMAYISPATSAFLTGLGSAWVPLIGWLIFRSELSRTTLCGLGLGIGGALVLSLAEGADAGPQEGAAVMALVGMGMTVGASVLFAAQILFLDRVGQWLRPVQLSAGFFTGNALAGVALVLVVAAAGPGLGPWGRWSADMATRVATVDRGGEPFNFPIAAGVALLVIFPTVLAFHWMNTYQPHVPANRAALIYLLEPVFAGAFSLLAGMDQINWYLPTGGALILLGNLVVELSRGPHKPPPFPSVVDQG